jgi:two-component system, chemotaxis family, CheB/CheR fusion protein
MTSDQTAAPPAIQPAIEGGFAGTIVALGASAGGLDALDRFFSALQGAGGAAFVVIQHLAPEHKTMMDTLLARHTAMPVLVATDDVPLQAGHVYVIPPGAMMTVSSGRLHLAPRPATGLTLPIDAFFESLAIEAASRAIGIILSGTGSDGSRGAQALDEAGAWVLAQDPACRAA